MSEERPKPGSLPDELEDEVLRILEGSDEERDLALRELLARNPQHSRTVRSWLASAGVELHDTVISDHGGHGTSSGNGNGIDDSGDALPLRLGNYTLTQKLGRGGFGTVYRAEQQEPIRRMVAVKVLNPGMDSREVLARFAAEREALNRMDHPGIARLLDAGSTPKGRPYFVMELVAGPPLAIHCRNRRVPLRSRVQLFLLVLDAMQHAHQKAVVHRDLSSNNVLVAEIDGKLQPKVIDFGIAKSLSSPLLQGGAMTFAGTLMGTPEFMSPEQAAGSVDDLDTRADVYALGVQLYELLADQLPIPGVVLRAQGLAGIANVVRSYVPAPPSQVAPAERRSMLRGDLDAIVLKAIAKVPDERYGSVAEFAADLRAFLADQPVRVSSPSRWTRLAKFVRRNRAQTVAGLLLTAGVVAAFAAIMAARDEAQDAAAEAERMRIAVEKRADAGFNLLAGEDLVDRALAAECALPPPWPQHEALYVQWLRDYEAPMQRRADEVAKDLATRQRLAASPLDDAEELQAVATSRYLHQALQRLQGHLRQELGPNGCRARVRRRLEMLCSQFADTDPLHTQAAWQACNEALRSEPRRRRYRNLRLRPQPGLVPLGPDPQSGLLLFLDLATHRPGAPLPVHGDGPTLGPIDADCGIVFVLVPPDLVHLGARRGQPGTFRNDEFAVDGELDGGSLTMAPFLLARTEMTHGQWARLVDKQPADDASLPVTGVDHSTAQQWLVRFGMTLPTEAQWEYACRGGTGTAWCGGQQPQDGEAFGWLHEGPMYPGQKRSNGFGLFDLHGNVAEWCLDEWWPYRESRPRAQDGLREPRDVAAGAVPAAGERERVVRGGSWMSGERSTRATARDWRPPDWRDNGIGVRPARLLQP